MGLTATATVETVASIANELMLEEGSDSVIKDTPLPNNLVLSISKDKNRDNALINLLHGERFKNCNSIIVYCIRREECERIASFIRTNFQVIKILTSYKSNKKNVFILLIFLN